TWTLAANGNTWSSLNINAGTLQIGNGGTTGKLGSGTIQNEGTLAFNLSSDLIVTNDINGIAGGVTQNGTGTVTLASSGNTYAGLTVVNSGRLLINGSGGTTGGAVVNGGSLGGTGTIGGTVFVQPAGALAPGVTIGTLTINSDLTLGGSVLVDVNRSLAQSNDLTVVNGTLSNTNNGWVVVNNLGPALVAGNRFQIFNQPVLGGELMTVVGAGAIWTNRLAIDGSIAVVSGTLPQPQITTTTVTSTNVVLSGTNGVAGNPYVVLTSTNLALPLSTWTRVQTNVFGLGGTFSTTNPVTAGEPQRFFLLQVP
ncbi:MAG: hypothetical protein H7Y43_15610, partial [Akkermansiaceae bacterium]|nr:hypothetical protein [Verrucomicrobiales bacterium]